MQRVVTIFAVTAAAFIAATPAIAAEEALKVIAIDAEGGASTLYITPQGQAVLIDAGWAAGRGQVAGAPAVSSTVDRIMIAAKAAGVTKLDYFVSSHHHGDHMGGFPELLGKMPIDTIVDHGPGGADSQNAYQQFETAITGKKRMIIKPGEQFRVGDLVFTAVNSNGEVISQPLQGAGSAGVGCDTSAMAAAPALDENARSVGLLVTWGDARILTLADTTSAVENKLVCPWNLIGAVDLMFVSGHGGDVSNAPALLASVKPRTVVFNNGATKGGDGVVLERFTAVSGKDAVWQLHFATRSPEANAPAAQITNIEGGADTAHPLNISVAKTGDVTFTNPRTGESRTYPKRR